MNRTIKQCAKNYYFIELLQPWYQNWLFGNVKFQKKDFGKIEPPHHKKLKRIVQDV